MKTKTLVVLCTLLFASLGMNAQKLTIASYNIRNDANSDDAKNGNGWQQRLPNICNLIEYHHFDIFGTQEGLHHQLENIKTQLPSFDYTGVGRDDGKQEGEHSAIFYKKEKFKLLDSGDFWISENTTKPNMGWDAVCIRICSWGKFKEKSSGKEFFFFNLHSDHVGIEARREGAKLVLAQIKKLAGNTPTILTGDFNVDQNNESYTLLNTSGVLKDAYELSPIKYAKNGTFNEFKIDMYSDSRIDHIFLTSTFKVTRYGILTDLYWDKIGMPRLPSDHYPVVIDAEF